MVNMAPVSVSFHPDENGVWIASCPDLQLATQGATFEEAERNLKDALLLFFESCLKRGTLGDVLAEAGYKPFQMERVHDYLNAYAPRALARGEACRA